MVVALLESASQAILGMDRTGHIVMANPKAQEIFGYSREELIGANVEMLLPEGGRAAHSRQGSGWIFPAGAKMVGSFPLKSA